MRDGVVKIHGKEYRTVARRVADFRIAFPAKDGWTIESEIIELSDSHATVESAIIDPDGRRIAVGLARDSATDSRRHENAFLEIAQTSAIGRALALVSADLMGSEFNLASADEVLKAKKEEDTGELAQMKARLREKFVLFRDEYEMNLLDYVAEESLKNDSIPDKKKALEQIRELEQKMHGGEKG